MTISTETAKKNAGRVSRIAKIIAPQHDIFKQFDGDSSLSFVEMLMKTGTEEASSQSVVVGEKRHPFDMAAMKNFRNWNPHHSRSIETKIACTVGLGFKDADEERAKQKVAERMMMAPTLPQAPAPVTKEDFDEAMAEANNRLKLSKAERILNPLCQVSLQDLLTSFASDYWDVKQAYIEVVRNGSGKITGLHWAPAEQMILVVEDIRYNRHYIQRSGIGGGDRHFAVFGDLEAFKERARRGEGGSMPREEAIEDTSELIVWRGPLSQSRWYSYPDWISGVPIIELVQMLIQHEFDFFQNRGVPEFLLFLLGKEIDDDEWSEIEDAIKAGIGLRKQHKSIAVNIKDPEVKVQLEKLAVEGKGGDSNADRSMKYALDVVTSHGVPPLLGNIVVPGKMGAANELTNALLGFQSLVIGPAQRSLWNVLATTLGEDPSILLTEEDFRLRAITDEFDLGKTDTMARMRTPLAQAQAEGRDLSQGLKQRGGDDKGEGDQE